MGNFKYITNRILFNKEGKENGNIAAGIGSCNYSIQPWSIGNGNNSTDDIGKRRPGSW